MAIFAGSCQQEKLEPVAGNGTVTFTVEAPANVQTKAIADGLNVNELVYEVWLTNELGELTQNAQKLYQATTTMDVENGVNKASITLDLVNDQKFTVLFWAQVKDTYVYDTQELTAVHYTNTAAEAYAANDERLAAFYAVAYVNDCRHVKKDGTPTGSEVKLRRPFAQLNLGTLNTSTAYDVALVSSKVKVTNANTVFNVATSVASEPQVMEFRMNGVPANPATLPGFDNPSYLYAGMNYIFAGDNATVEYDIVTKLNGGMEGTVNNTVSSVPLKENYRTNIIGNLLTSKVDYQIVVDANFNKPDAELGEIEGQTYTKVNNTAEFKEAFENEENDIVILGADINLNDLATRSIEADPTFVIGKGKTLTIDLNGFTLSSTSSQTGKNYNMLDVNGGTLTVKNGTITYEHKGENMGWNSSTNIFNVTAGGVLNLSGVTVKNLGGSDMGFVAHLNNWGEVTLNVENSTLESNYVAVRVFNSGPDMNNVTIKNSTLKGVSAAFWVHNYTSDDFGSEAKAQAQKALLNLNIYNQGNTFSPDVNGIRYGFTNSVRADAYGITKTVSEDGTEVTLGSVVEDGLIRRGVAGAEENTTITKVVVEEGVTTLYDRTFRRFYALETVELPSTLTTIGATGSGVFQSCTALKNIVLPEAVTVLGKGTFQECSSLESINIPSGVTRIEENALRATGLVSVEFHAGVTYFGALSFRDCKQLKEVIINAPEFTVEPNAFGVMSGALPGTTIYVANAEMKAYLESTLAYKNQFTIVAPNAVSDAGALADALANGENVVMTQDINTESATTAPYGNKYAFKLDGGVLDGNGHELYMECYGDDYGIMTSGGTIKNLTITEGCRAVMIMYPKTDVILDNVKIGGDGVLYPINTGEAGAEGVNLVVTNSVLAGWTSYGLIESATFTNVEFKQGTYYNNIYGRVLKPYVNTTMTNCSFVAHMNLDLSALGEGHKIVMKNCTVDGQAVNASVFTVPTTNEQYDTELFTIDLPSWANSINDCVVFE